MGSISEVILQHAKVLAIDQTSNEHQDTPKVAKLVTLEVSQEQALKILLAVNVGKLSLILRQASEVAVAPSSESEGERPIHRRGSSTRSTGRAAACRAAARVRLEEGHGRAVDEERAIRRAARTSR